VLTSWQGLAIRRSANRNLAAWDAATGEHHG
jgi:hypothetical protein